MTTAKKATKKTRTAQKSDAIEQIVKVTIEFDTEKKKRWLENSKTEKTESMHDRPATEAEFIAQASKRSKIPVAEIVRRGALMYARTVYVKSIGSSGSIDQGRIAKAYAKLVRAGITNITPVRLANACEPPSNSRSCEAWLTGNGHTFYVTYRGQTVKRGAV